MTHRTEIEIAWGDTDAGGLIYFPRFFHFVVVGLNDYFAPAVDGGHPMERLRRDGYALPSIDASASFESPLRAGDVAHVETTVTAGETSLADEFEIARPNGDRVAGGEVAFVLVDGDFEPTPLPDAFLECIHERGDASPA
ncbi:MAG: thioesterase family protein [Haloarculaceae archaeon]|jgi:acyl-CoA thioester hydrolase